MRDKVRFAKETKRVLWLIQKFLISDTTVDDGETCWCDFNRGGNRAADIDGAVDLDRTMISLVSDGERGGKYGSAFVVWYIDNSIVFKLLRIYIKHLTWIILVTVFVKPI